MKNRMENVIRHARRALIALGALIAFGATPLHGALGAQASAWSRESLTVPPVNNTLPLFVATIV